MKKMYFFVLTLITTAFVLGLALLKVNEACSNELFSIPANFSGEILHDIVFFLFELLFNACFTAIYACREAISVK